MIPFLHGVFATNGGVASDFELIETQTVGAGGAASVTFSSIPSTYKHLQIRYIARQYSGGGTSWTSLSLTCNSDTGANYTRHSLYGNGSTAGSYANTGNSSILLGNIPQSGNTSGIFAAGIIDILDYANTSKNKTVRQLIGLDLNGSGQLDFASGLWISTSAISTLNLAHANSFAQYSTFSLYGVK